MAGRNSVLHAGGFSLDTTAGSVRQLHAGWSALTRVQARCSLAPLSSFEAPRVQLSRSIEVEDGRGRTRGKVDSGLIVWRRPRRNVIV